MGRKIAAIIDLDEEMAEELKPDTAPGEYIEKEFGCLKQSGISLEEYIKCCFAGSIKVSVHTR